jgi:hypothetical protein
MIEPTTKRGQILMQLAIDHEGSVGSEQMRHRSYGKFAGLVRVAEQKFAGRERCPGLAIGQQLALSGLGAALDAEVVGIAEAIGEAEVLPRGGLAVDDLGGGILEPQQGCSSRFLESCLNGGLAGIDRGSRLAVDAQPEVDILFLPERVPVGGRVDPGIAEKLGAAAHALLEFDGEGNQRGQREFEAPKSSKGKSDIEGALRLVSVPTLTRGDLAEQPVNQLTTALGSFQPQKKIAGHGQVVAAQNEALDIAGVELTHCDRLS